MTYRQTRNGWENQNRWIFEGEGAYGMPRVNAVHGVKAEGWLPFNYAPACKRPERHSVHFYIDDYQFARVWSRPGDYLRLLGGFQAVASPDFSSYLGFPLAVRIYNVFRNRWLAAWWQLHGITVVPNAEWGTREDFSWILDGLPAKSDIIVSSVGALRNRESRRLWLEGFETVLKRLEPERVFFHGTVPEEAEGVKNIIRIEAFTERFDEIREKELSDGNN